jgi:hypothetical protein
VLELQRSGHEIGGRTRADLYLSTLESDRIRREICDERVTLLDLGVRATSFAYPFGDDTAGVRRIAELCGYNSARDSGGLVTGYECTGCPLANPMPPEDAYQVKTIGSIGAVYGTTLEDLQGYVTQAESNGGGWVPIVFGHVCEGCGDLDAVTPAVLTEFLDWLAARQATGTVVMTVNEVMGGALRAGVAGPAVAPAANLIENPSLEFDANHDNLPDCWQGGGDGTNTAEYSQSSAAFNGRVAQQLAITSYTSGSRRLELRDECALVARPGQSYVVSGWYFATTPPRYQVHYRNLAGSWTLLAESPELPTSASYVRASLTTPAVPGDATAIRIGVSVSAAGAVTMDAFTIQDANLDVRDTRPPTVALISPTTGATIGETITITAEAKDTGNQLSHVDFRVGDRLENFGDGTSVAIDWAAPQLAGRYVITARAFDLTGNVTTSAPITVTVAP